MPRKLDDLAVEAVRDGFAAGQSVSALAGLFDVSERHVRRLVAGIEQGPPRFVVDPDATVVVALERFLADLDLGPRDHLRAATARVLAGRLDCAGARDAPQLARALVDVLDELRGVEEPDALDDLNRRREARLLAMRAAGA